MVLKMRILWCASWDGQRWLRWCRRGEEPYISGGEFVEPVDLLKWARAGRRCDHETTLRGIIFAILQQLGPIHGRRMERKIGVAIHSCQDWCFRQWTIARSYFVSIFFPAGLVGMPSQADWQSPNGATRPSCVPLRTRQVWQERKSLAKHKFAFSWSSGREPNSHSLVFDVSSICGSWQRLIRPLILLRSEDLPREVWLFTSCEMDNDMRLGVR